MARNREKRGSLTRQVQVVYDDKLAIGQSKHFDKSHGGIQDKIYSWETYRSYLKHANYFVSWCKEQHGCRTLDECRPHVDEWLQTRSELSAYTQKLEASALAKLYSCSTKDFVKTRVRNRSDITRSRGDKIRDRHFSEENHSALVKFCKSTGLRRSELKNLIGDKLIEKDGKPYIVVSSGSKGGRYREAPVIGEVKHVKELMTGAGTERVFKSVPNGADIHSYRAEYATAIYKEHKRPIEQIPYDKINKGTGRVFQSEVYHCRGDQKGQVMDKKAMMIASQALGHNRISVVGEHYIRR